MVFTFHTGVLTEATSKQHIKHKQGKTITSNQVKNIFKNWVFFLKFAMKQCPSN